MSASEIILGKAGGRNGTLDIELLLKTRLLVQANSGGGKSFLLRRLAEQLFGKVQVILLDPEGEFATLRERFGYVLVGEGGETPADPRSAALLAQRLLELRASAVCDLYESFRTRPMERRAWVRKFLEALIDAPKKLWHPLVVIVDEAHKFCPEQVPKAASMADRETITGCKEAMVSLATTGRKRAFCAVWATQRLAKLDKDASAEMLNRLVGMTFEDVDIARAAELLSISGKDDLREFKAAIKVLEPGHFYALGRAITKERILIKVGPVQTSHPEPGAARHQAEAPPTPEKIKRLLPQLADLPKEAEQEARSVAEFKQQIRALKNELRQAHSRTSAPAAPSAVKDKTAESAKAQLVAMRRALEEVMKFIVTISAQDLTKLEESDREALTKAIAAAIQPIVRGAEDRLARNLKEFQGLKAQAARLQKSIAAILDKKTVTAIDLKLTTHEPFEVKPQRNMRPAPSSGPAISDGNLPSGQRKMLAAVAQYPEGATREQLSILTGLRRSTRDRYLQYLFHKSLVKAANNGTIIATEEGIAALGGDFEPLPTGAALQAWWLARLPEGQAKILRFIIEAGGQPVHRDAIGEAVGLQRSTRDRYIQYLTAAKVVEAEGRGAVRASPLLFS